mgnify:CR=1 FL=1
MEIEHLQKLERAMRKGRLEQVRFGLGLLFVLSVMLYTASLNDGNVSMTMVIAAMVGAYMAMNIGANDVANNVGPAVGSKAMNLGTALVIAAIFEAAGAIIAGGEVVGTIRNGIIDPAMIPDTAAFVRLMLAALMAGALLRPPPALPCLPRTRSSVPYSAQALPPQGWTSLIGGKWAALP